MRSRRGADPLALVFLAAAVALFFWPVWLAGYRFPAGGGDLWGQLYPVWSFVAEWLQRGVFPLWDNRMMGGDPILAEGQYGLFNPLNWPLFLAYPIPKWLVLLRGVLSLWLAGAGLYLYLHHSPVWRLGTPASLVGAIAYMFADPFVVHLGHPQFNDCMAWLPWSLWAVDRAVRRARGIPLAALAIALLVLAGHGQASLYGAVTVGFYGLWQGAEGGWPKGLRRLGRLGLVGLVGVALAAPALLPGLERLPLTERAGVPWELRRGYEFPPTMLVDFLTPAYHGRGAQGFWPPWDRVESGYVGAVALCLAGLGVLGGLRQRRAWMPILLGVLAYTFSLGYQGPLYPHLAHLPLFAESWKTARAIFLVSFALAIAAGLGVERLRSGLRGTARLWVCGLALSAGLVWYLAPRWVMGVPEGPSRIHALVGLRSAASVVWGTTLLGWGAAAGRRWAYAGLPLLLLAELVAMGALAEVEPAPEEREYHPEALAFLRADPGWFRVDVDPTARGLWPPVFLQMAGFEVPQGTGNPMELREFNVLRWSIPSATNPAYRLLGVKYLIVPKGSPPGGEGIWPVFMDDPAVDVHLNTMALPRVWLVYRTEPVATYGEALQRVLDDGFRPEEVAVVQDGPRLDAAGRGRIEVGYYDPNRVLLRVQTDAPALLVISDTFYPGWRAIVDGDRVPIYHANAAFRGVLIPIGTHRVEMCLEPCSLQIGLGLIGAAGLVSLAIALRFCSRR